MATNHMGPNITLHMPEGYVLVVATPLLHVPMPPECQVLWACGMTGAVSRAHQSLHHCMRCSVTVTVPQPRHLCTEYITHMNRCTAATLSNHEAMMTCWSSARVHDIGRVLEARSCAKKLLKRPSVLTSTRYSAQLQVKYATLQVNDVYYFIFLDAGPLREHTHRHAIAGHVHPRLQKSKAGKCEVCPVHLHLTGSHALRGGVLWAKSTLSARQGRGIDHTAPFM